MAKDKLITLLITEEKRDRLKQHCADLGLNVSQVLTKCIDDILAGSIDPSTNTQTTSLPIDIDLAIGAAIARRQQISLDDNDAYFQETSQTLEQHTKDISDLEMSVWECQQTIKNLTELVNQQNTINTELDPKTKQALVHTIKPEQPYKTHSSDEIYLSDEKYTLEDTQTYLQGKGDYNRTREKMSDRISQDDIAIHLQTYNYPHPNNRKWTRDEVRKVCKLWQIATK